MKTILLYIAILSTVIATAQCPLIQPNVREDGFHFKDLSMLEIDDTSADVIVAGTRFTSNFSGQKLKLTRMNSNSGAVVWEQYYDGHPITRGFDITQYSSGGSIFLAVTGYAGDGTNLNQAYIVLINAATGAVVQDKAYDITGVTHAQGLHIIHTVSTIGGVSTPGFVISGFITEDYQNPIMNSVNGFIMRTDMNLNALWTRTTNSTTTMSIDYDMLNHVTETNGGFFVTGSSNDPTGNQQGIAMMKFDFDGNLLWEQNYLEGNSRDVATDALYDFTTGTIYVLTYYSFSHFFGITAIDDATGAIDSGRTWGASGNDLNWTGFSLQFSNDPIAGEDLVIFGYKRDEQVIDPGTGTQVNANTVPFAVSFNKFTTTINRTALYPVPYADPTAYTDYFRYWDGQSPLIFHPDIGISLLGGNCYAMIGNRSYGQNTTGLELVRFDHGFANACNSASFTINQFAITPTFIDATVQAVTPAETTFTLTAVPTTGVLGNCEDGGILATSSFNIDEIEIYPNPASEIINVSGLFAEAAYSIYDMQGKLLQSNTMTENSINISGLSQGVYFLKVSVEGNSTIKKFIKN